VLARVFWRCLFLQAAWNRRGMQNLGFAYAIDPALRWLYADPAKRAEALARHLRFFNCHPYMAAAILGGAIQHEERVAMGEEPASGPLQYKQTLQGPLAAVGDGFFWTALRPFFGVLGASGALLFGWPAVAVVVVAYNVVHFTLRIRLFRAGYERGDGVVGEVARLELPIVAGRLRAVSAVLTGVAGALVLLPATHAGAAAVFTAIAVTGVGYLLLSRGVHLLRAAYGAALVGAGVALVAARLHWSP
jgi:PTS system mannose-specific IID component